MTQTLREAVGTVLEGFTLPHDVRKILETAYFGTVTETSFDVMTDYPNGMTVRDLKAIVNALPDTNEHGENHEVWIAVDDDGSNQVKSVWPLNARYANGDKMTSADILLEARTK